jgi:hypothetical protein
MSHPDLENIIPGEILLEDWMKPMGLSQNALARALDVPPRRIPQRARFAGADIPADPALCCRMKILELCGRDLVGNG